MALLLTSACLSVARLRCSLWHRDVFIVCQSAILGMWEAGWANNCCCWTHRGHLTRRISWPAAPLTLFVCSLSIKCITNARTHTGVEKKNDTHKMHYVVATCTFARIIRHRLEHPQTHTPWGRQTSLRGTSGDVLLCRWMCLTRDGRVCCQHPVSPNHHLTLAFCL